MPTKISFPAAAAAKIPIWTHGGIPVHSDTGEASGQFERCFKFFS